MCIVRFIKKVLDPKNVLGRKRDWFVLPMVHPPYVSKTFEIEWIGKRLDVSYVSYARRDEPEAIKTPVNLSFENAQELTEEEFIVRQDQRGFARVWASNISLKCTNVTYLVINGERYI